MGRIPTNEFKQIQEMVLACRAETFKLFKKNYFLPDPCSTSKEAALSALSFIKDAFIAERFTLLDAIVATTGRGPVNDNDTHYRGRVLEAVLGGSFNGKPTSDFGYAELKLIETKDPNTLIQVMTAGAIFSKERGEYIIVDRFEDSNFYKKMKRTIMVTYKKVGRQMGFCVNGAFLFEVQDQRWFDKLKEDWDCIRDAMIKAINDEALGHIKRKKSGILSSRLKTPNGYLGVRSDSVTISPKFFAIISK